MNSLAAEGRSPLIRNFIRGSSSMRFSSRSLHWHAVDLERHVVLPTELPEGSIDCILVVKWQGSSVARGEHPGSGGSYVSYAKRPGTLTLLVPGTLPPVRSSTNSDFLLCALNREFVSKVGEEISDERRMCSSHSSRCIARDEPSFHDDSLTRLLLLLEDEVKSSGISGPLYAEHLAHALAMRLFTLENGDIHETSRRAVGDLPAKVLGQLLDRIEANPIERFDLTNLAAEYGYSYGRFLRDFRASTGFSPHKYITRQRLERAKRLMHKRSLTLLEIALDTGFAGQAHFTHAFRQHFGCAPSHFRDALKK